MNKKLKIGIDLDDTLLDFITPFLNILRETYNLDATYEDWTDYHFEKKFDISSEKGFEMLKDFFSSEKFGNLDLLPHAEESILILWKDFELNFITARTEILTREKTEKNLTKHFPNLDYNLFFAGKNNDNKEKHEICNEQNIKLIVEDHGENALLYAKSGLKVLLFNHPWNQEVDHKNITRVNDWKQVTKEILNYFEKIGRGKNNGC